MKNLHLSVLVCLLLTACNQRETLIINPDYDNANTNLRQVSKIELTDTATIIYLDVYNRPNYWVKIESATTLRGNSGKLYKLLSSNDFELNKEVYMPENGNMTATLLFEPLDKSEKTIDYIEDDSNSSDFQINGIKLYSVKNNAPIKCVLKGEVINRPQSSRITLSKKGEDLRSAKVTYIPIRNGKFEYTLDCNVEEAYELTFFEEYQYNGSWRPISFIAEQGTLEFKLNSMDEWENNIITGGTLNPEKQKFDKELSDIINPLYEQLNVEAESLYNANQYYTDEYNKLEEKINNLNNDNPEKNKLRKQLYKLIESGEAYTPATKALEKKGKDIWNMQIEKQLQYAENNINIIGYDYITQNIRTAIEHYNSDINNMVDVYNKLYKAKYPDHPYTAMIENHIQASAVKEGGQYIDVTAQNKEGKDVKLSELINGKVAVIHLWASWCGPCRKGGQELIPIYNEYKGKGFTVVGIARENNKENMLTALEKDNHPWVDLLELNDNNNIWTKYGIGNAGGKDFLVDNTGKILAVAPSAEQVREILDNLLN